MENQDVPILFRNIFHCLFRLKAFGKIDKNIRTTPSARGVFLDIKEEKFHSVRKNVPTSTQNGDNFSIV